MTSSADTEKSSLRQITNVKYDVTSSIGVEQQQDDVVEPGVVVDRAAHVERQVNPVVIGRSTTSAVLPAGELPPASLFASTS